MDARNCSYYFNLKDSRILGIPAQNSIEFLTQVFACWRERRLFSIIKDVNEVNGLYRNFQVMPLGDAATGGWARFEYEVNLSDSPAQIVFSSGTEGRPKGILISHRNLADVTQRLNAIMDVTNEIREYIGVPVTYSFGLGRARAVAAAGGAFFLPERFDPLQIRDMLAADQINAVSAVPSLWRQILAHPDVIGDLGARLRWIEIGSQYMSAADKKAMRSLFPNARIIQHYGLTEASRSTFLDISTASDESLESVGTATGSVGIRITHKGAIALRGDHVATGVIDDNGTLLPLTDADGWLETSDRGEIRDGMLHYLGRLDDQINIAGIKLAAEDLEARIRELVPAAGSHIAIAAVPDPARGEAVLLAIETSLGDHAALIEEAARLALLRSGVSIGQGINSALKILHAEQLPRTGTDKIQRRLLPAMWQHEMERITLGSDLVSRSGDAVSESPLSRDEARLASIWAEVLGPAIFTPAASFYDLGGDSLSSVQIGMVMEKAGLPRSVIRATFEGRSLRNSAALMSANAQDASEHLGPLSANLSDVACRSWAITMTRALAALSVVVSHWGPGFFGALGVAQQAESLLSLIYRMGTPGFAAIFGIGIGYFMLSDFCARRATVLRRLDASFRLVLLGLCLLAIFNLANILVGGGNIGGLEVAHAFYSVLAYYAMMLGTARWWLPFLARHPDMLRWLPLAFPVLWLVWKAMPGVLPVDQLHSLWEWPRLMLGAGYNIFKMTSITALGMAVGLWMARQQDSRRMAQTMLLLGLMGMTLPLLTLIEAHGPGALTTRTDPAFTSLPGLLLYLSAMVFCIGLFLRLLLSWTRLGRALRLPMQMLLVIGGLALPIYVFHGIVIPGRDLLLAAGLSSKLALVLVMGVFLASMAWMGRRLWRMYFV